MHKKFLAARKKVIKRKKLQLNDTPKIEHLRNEDDEENDEVSTERQLDQIPQPSHHLPARSSMKWVDSTTDVPSPVGVASRVQQQQSQTVRSSFVSTSDVSSSTTSKRK